MPLHPVIAEKLRNAHEDRIRTGKSMPLDRLQRCYETFRREFGPEALSALDDEELLERMHAHGRKDSLVYWLEFKDDEELPAHFGSIAGGSALKFGIYRSSDTGMWTIGSAQKQQQISVGEAIKIARKHRDQLLRGCDLLDRIVTSADDSVYRKLQSDLESEAPDIVNTGWGHKYFYLIHPDKLDDFHSTTWHRFHLIKLLQVPPEGCGEPWGKGRFLAAGRFNAIAHELGWASYYLTGALNAVNGEPHEYWRIGTKLGGTESIWNEMRDGNFIAIGFSRIPNLAGLQHNQASKEKLLTMMKESSDDPPNIASNKTNQVFKFVVDLRIGDRVVAMDGDSVMGIGQINGDYFYEASDFPHRRPVEWLNTDQWMIPEAEGLRRTVHQMKKNPKNLVEIERRLLRGPVPPPPPVLAGIPADIDRILARKKQVILYGPPGTGKTFWGERCAYELAARRNFKCSWSEVDEHQRRRITGDAADGLVRLCAFHPNYGYEDFIEGYRPVERNGQLAFELRDGIFKKMCAEASGQPDNHYYLIIDEINRGDIPRIFGELLTLLEADKRGKTLLLPLSGKPFSVPPNLYLIGTMNTADRSIALLDTALRRRFGFIELLPEPQTLDDLVLEGVPLRGWLRELNRRIVEFLGQEGRNLRIGHAYLMPQGQTVSGFAQFARILRVEIMPVMEEYCYEDLAIIEKLLGEKLIDLARMRVREELFEDAMAKELASAVLAPSPDLATTSSVVESETESGEEAEEADEEAEEEIEEGTTTT